MDERRKHQSRDEWRKWYKRKGWQDLRFAQLSKQPLCERCLKSDKYVAADVVNHKIPHKGNWSLFNDPANLESVCKQCHDSTIQHEEKHGFNKSVGVDGWPVDDKHPFNKERE